ncbi:MAG: DNA translocase FtsK [Sciscionella sp.]
MEDERPRLVEVPQRQFVRAARMVTSSQYASASMLQRRLRVDTGQAARLMLALEGAGVIAGAVGGRARRVLVTLAEVEAVFERFGIIEDALPADTEPH